jgi:hypothetical protein
MIYVFFFTFWTIEIDVRRGSSWMNRCPFIFLQDPSCEVIEDPLNHLFGTDKFRGDETKLGLHDFSEN